MLPLSVLWRTIMLRRGGAKKTPRLAFELKC
jgi:hypothetical protein